MDLELQACQLRDKINAYAPDALKDMVSDPWILCMIMLEPYYKALKGSRKVKEQILYMDNLDDLSVFLPFYSKVLFRLGYTINQVAKLVNEPASSVREWIAESYPVPEGWHDLTVSKVENALRKQSPDTQEELAIRMQESKTNYTPRPYLVKDIVTRKLIDGSCAGAIAQEFGVYVQDVLACNSVLYDVSSAYEQMSVINDWLCGKSSAFIINKYGLTENKVSNILHTAGYMNIGGNFNIRDVNKIRVQKKSLPYATVTPRLTSKDRLTLKNMNVRDRSELSHYLGVPADEVLSFIGTGEVTITLSI